MMCWLIANSKVRAFNERARWQDQDRRKCHGAQAGFDGSPEREQLEVRGTRRKKQGEEGEERQRSDNLKVVAESD